MKLRILLGVMLCLLCTPSAFSQSVVDEEPIPYQLVDVKPQFQGGDPAGFNEWISQHLVYPESAVRDGLHGRVVLQITIQKDGTVAGVKVLRGVDPSLDNEAVRVVSKSPAWTPGKHQGRAVPVTYTLPIIFNQQPAASHRYVDLGLSVKWATCNIGATSPEGYGHYFAWGETYTKSCCHEDYSATYGKAIDDFSGNAQYDAARAIWGEGWRIPTKAEFKELRDKCEWTWTTQNGRNGYKITSKINGNSIFLPAAGSQYLYDSVDKNERGNYWTSTPDEQILDWSYALSFQKDLVELGPNGRWGGECIRPVMD